MSIAPQEVNRGYVDHIREWSQRGRFGLSSLAGTAGRTLVRLIAAPFAFAWGVTLLIYLRIVIAVRGRGKESAVHERALDSADEFVRQYPMHLYPVVAKALELAYLREALPRLAPDAKHIAEIAIGEGTLSARLFDGDRRVVGVDLNPYSLKKATLLPHVKTAVIGDGLNPPLVRGAFDLLVSNNFLHHVSDKEGTVRNWASVARRLVFNDNSPYWSRGFARPYVLRLLGGKAAAEEAAKKLERHTMQHLETREELVRHVADTCDIVEEVSFMAWRTFFFCASFSAFLRAYGPPTPLAIKWLYNGPLRPVAIPLTRALARALIRFDVLQDRKTDTYITLVCDGREFKKADTGGALRCPACEGAIASDTCTRCGATYDRRDGMLFLLPPELAHIASQYSPEAFKNLPSEHL